MTKRRLGKALDRLDSTKKTRDRYIPGVLGINLNGNQTVEVPNREGFVYVKLRNNASEIIQAFNGGTVSPVFNLPVLVFRDEIDRTRYRIHGRDTAQYQNWGTAAYLGKHGNSHSFAPERGGGGDIVWVYDRQFVPLHIHPSGSVGSENVIIEEDVYYWEGNWRYAGNTGTPNLVSLKPTDSQARLMLIYLDDNSNPAIATGTFFDGTITGTSQIIPYLPSLPSTQGVPLGAVRLVSGTERILWGNIYDLRPLIVGDGFIPTGTYGRTILDDGSPLTNRGALNFVGDFFTIYDDPINEHTIISGSSYNDQFVNITGDTMTGLLDVEGDVVIGTQAGTARTLSITDQITLLHASTNAHATIRGPVNRDLRFDLDGNTATDNFLFRNVGSLGSIDILAIRADGQVGIGISSPDGTLHVHTSSAGSVAAAANADDLIVENTNAAGISILSGDTVPSSIYFGSPIDNQSAYIEWQYGIGGGVTALIVGTHIANGKIAFTTGDNNEVARLTSDGNFLLGTTTDPSANDGKVMVFGDNAADPTMGTNTAGIYGKDVAGTVEMFAIDEGSAAQQLTPHDPKTGKWIAKVRNRKGIWMQVELEDMMRKLNDMLGGGYIKEWME